MIGIWTATEQQSVPGGDRRLPKKFPGVTVSYTSAGNELPTILKTRIAGGKPPDVAVVGQPCCREFAQKGQLKPLTFAQGGSVPTTARTWIALGP